MKKVYIATLISFVFLFSSNVFLMPSSSALEDRIGRPGNVTEEQILELKDEIVSNLQEALSLIVEGDLGHRKQAISLLKKTLKNISTFVVWEDHGVDVVDLPENAKASKKQIREAIRHLSKGNLDKAKPLIETAVVIWDNQTDA